MAKTESCSKDGYKHYNGGWSSFSTNFYGGYAGNTKYAVMLKITTPDFKGQSVSLKITIPWIRQSSTAKSGTLYFYIMSSNYTGTPGNMASNSAVLHSGSASWSASDQETHTTSCTISSKTLKPNTVYYIGVRCSTDFLEVGYNSSNKSKFVFDLTYNQNLVHVCTNSTSNTWKQYIPWICTNSTSNTWKQYIPWICTNSTSNTWKQYGGA